MFKCFYHEYAINQHNYKMLLIISHLICILSLKMVVVLSISSSPTSSIAFGVIPIETRNCNNLINSVYFRQLLKNDIIYRPRCTTCTTYLEQQSSNNRHSSAGTSTSTSSSSNNSRHNKITSSSKQKQQQQQSRPHHQKYNSRFNNNNVVEKTVVIAYNKPLNVLTTHSNDEAAMIVIDKKTGSIIQRQTVYNDIQTLHGWVGGDTTIDRNTNTFESITGIQSKLHAIGRLDCDTTGLLLVTNDGGLVHHITNPIASSRNSNHNNNNDGNKTTKIEITKTYEAIIMGYYNNTCIEFTIMRTIGINIGEKYGGMTKPVINLIVLEYPTNKSTKIQITLKEGKNRQIRRMFHSIGSGVIQLKRTSITGCSGKITTTSTSTSTLSLDGIENIGQWRILSDTEIYNCFGWKCRTIVSNS